MSFRLRRLCLSRSCLLRGAYSRWGNKGLWGLLEGWWSCGGGGGGGGRIRGGNCCKGGSVVAVLVDSVVFCLFLEVVFPNDFPDRKGCGGSPSVVEDTTLSNLV